MIIYKNVREKLIYLAYKQPAIRSIDIIIYTNININLKIDIIFGEFESLKRDMQITL